MPVDERPSAAPRVADVALHIQPDFGFQSRCETPAYFWEMTAWEFDSGEAELFERAQRVPVVKQDFVIEDS